MIAVDLFAGWGGFTLGAELAGVPVAWASNHWPLAVEAHALNHPKTEHVCQDLRQADWTALPDFDLLLASPACQGHSTASQPRRRGYHDAMRATARAVIDCVEITRPMSLIVENVPAFARWDLFDLWYEALRRFGYHLEIRQLTASLMGAPQRRTRLFIVGHRRPFELPALEAADELPFGPCVDWTAGRWRSITEARPKARARIDAARERFGYRALVQHVTGHRGIALDEPIRTITTKDQWAVIDGDRYRPLTVRETARAMGFPDDYGWPSGSGRKDRIRGLGNAVCPPQAARIIGAVAAL